MDWQALLRKYMDLVGTEEGFTFLERLVANPDGTYKGVPGDIVFTQAEYEALRTIDNELIKSRQ